jgi:hypothetical protein
MQCREKEVDLRGEVVIQEPGKEKLCWHKFPKS